MATTGTKRIVTTKPRSESISDVRKLDISKLTIDEAASKSGDVYIQELSGVVLKRISKTEQLGDGSGTIPCYDYEIENNRDYKCRIIMEFKGSNLKVSAFSHASKKDDFVIEGLLAKGSKALFAQAASLDGKNDFSFSAEIKVLPDQDDIRVADLEGVKLYTSVTYNDLITIMQFDAENTKNFDVELELDLKGQLLEKSGELPFKVLVPAGKKVFVGKAKSNVEIESSWKWQQLTDPISLPEGAVIEDKKITQTSELKGVTLKQSMIPGDPTLIEFEVFNSREKKISVSVDLEGDGFISFRNQQRPLVAEVHSKQTAFVGVVEIKGDATVNWKYKEISE